MSLNNVVCAAIILANVAITVTLAQVTALDALETKIHQNPDDSDALLRACASNDLRTVALCRLVFNSARETSSKEVAAIHMIRRGFKEDGFIDFLLNTARKAIEDDVPFISSYGPDGKMIKNQFNPGFEAWCRARGLTTQQGVRLINERSRDIRMFLVPDYPQIIPLLQRCLNRQTEQVASACAQTLAEIDHRQSIPMIMARIRSVPTDARYGLLLALAAFDGPEAETALVQFVPESKRRESLRKVASPLNGAATWRHFTPREP